MKKFAFNATITGKVVLPWVTLKTFTGELFSDVGTVVTPSSTGCCGSTRPATRARVF